MTVPTKLLKLLRMTMKILALDIDGTLISPINEKNKIHNELQYLASYCQDKQFKIILATGRSKEEIYKDFYLIDILKPIFLITNCGMEVFSQDNNDYIEHIDYENFVNNHDDNELFECEDFLKRLLPNIYIQGPERQFKHKKSYYIHADDIPVLHKYISEVALKYKNTNVVVNFESKHVHFLDIQHASISKYGALNFILTELKIHNDQALFFGDNGNDMSIMMNLKNAYIFNQFQDELSLFYGIKNKNRFLGSLPGPKAIVETLKQDICDVI